MEKELIPLGSAPALPPHPPADMLNLFMSRYDYDYNRDPGGSLGSGSQAGSGMGDDGDGTSGAVRNRPIYAYDVADAEKNTTYRVDYVPPGTAFDMHKIVDAAYSCGPGDGSGTSGVVGTSEGGDGGVFAREWFTLPGAKKLDATDISIYKTDYTADAADPNGTAASRPGMQATAFNTADLYPGAPAVPYKEDFLTVKSGAKEDDGEDIAPKITSEESLRPKKLRTGRPSSPSSLEGGEGQGSLTPGSISAAALRSLMTNASPPWVPGVTTGGLAASSTTADRVPDDMTNQYSCESWLYGDTSRANPSQLPQGFAGSARADLLEGIIPGSTRNISNNNSGALDNTTAGGEEEGDRLTTATLLRRLGGQHKRAAGKANAPLALFDGSGGDGSANVDETNPIYITLAEQRKCASRHKLADEGFVKGVTIYQADFVDQGRLPELPGNKTGAAHPRETDISARATVGEMTTGVLTADARTAATLRNSHGTLLSNKAIAAKMMSVQGSGSEKVAAKLVAALPTPDSVIMMRGMERHDAVDKADPHRRKLR